VRLTNAILGDFSISTSGASLLDVAKAPSSAEALFAEAQALLQQGQERLAEAMEMSRSNATRHTVTINKKRKISGS